MFASLGFKVDTTGLANFKKSLVDARKEMTNLGRGTKSTTRQLRNLKNTMGQINTQMAKLKGTAGTKEVRQAYKNMAGAVRQLDNALNSITANRPKTTKALGKIHASVKAGEPLWSSYRRSVVQTRRALLNLNGEINRLRSNSRVDIRINRRENTYRGESGGAGSMGALLGFGGGMGLRGLLSSFLPTALVGGGLGSVGYLGAKAVETGREQHKMESMILMTSKSAEEYSRTIDYVRSEALRLGLSSVELGKSFSQISMSARELSQSQKEQMFTGMSEFMMSVGTSKDDQKGIFRAVNQMFSYNRILQEEINQLSERGIPATLVYDAAMKAYDKNNIAEIKKMQEDGKLDPKLVLTEMARMMQKMAHDSGSFEKMQNSSNFKQGQFQEQLSQFATQLMQSGLDEMLGNIFGKLTELTVAAGNLVVAIEYIVNSLKWLKNELNEANSWSNILLIVLGFLVFRFRGLTSGIRKATTMLKRNQGVVKSLEAFMKRAFGRTLTAIIKRFGSWITVIYLAAKALSFLGDQIKRSNRGEWTFFDEVFASADRLGLRIQILWQQLRGFFLKAKILAMNPIDAFRTIGQHYEVEILKLNNRANADAGLRYPIPDNLNIQEQLRKATQPDDPLKYLRPTGAFSDRTPPPREVHHRVDIYMDGNKEKSLYLGLLG